MAESQEKVAELVDGTTFLSAVEDEDTPFAGFPKPSANQVRSENEPRRYGAQRGASGDSHPQTAPIIDLNQHRTSEEHLANALEKLASLIQPNRSPRLPTTYSGADWEDPHAFLQEGEQYCRRLGLESAEWTANVADRLRGVAHAWYDQLRNAGLSFTHFRTRLLDRFDSPAVVSNLYAKLYGQHQAALEDTDVFITRKLALIRRLAPEMPESVQVQRIIELLHPEIRINVRGVTMETGDQLIHQALAVSEDLRALRTCHLYGVSRPENSSRAFTTRNMPPYPCQTCGGNHFHRDCPIRNRSDARGPGSTRGVEAVAGPSNRREEGRLVQRALPPIDQEN